MLEYLVLCRWWHFIFEFEVWEWCKNVWYSSYAIKKKGGILFENDVKMYGTQAPVSIIEPASWFENDVKMYGTQANENVHCRYCQFENDVKMYGTQASTTQFDT